MQSHCFHEEHTSSRVLGRNEDVSKLSAIKDLGFWLENIPGQPFEAVLQVDIFEEVCWGLKQIFEIELLRERKCVEIFFFRQRVFDYLMHEDAKLPSVLLLDHNPIRPHNSHTNLVKHCCHLLCFQLILLLLLLPTLYSLQLLQCNSRFLLVSLCLLVIQDLFSWEFAH